MKRFLLLIIVCAFSTIDIFGIQLEKIDSWRYKNTYWGPISGSLMDSNGDIILQFRRKPVVFNKKESVPFAPFGQGPDEITHLYTICDYKGDLALFVDINRIKIFIKSGNSYRGQQTIWLKRDPLPLFLKKALYYKEHFFLAGMNMLSQPTKEGVMNISNLRIVQENSTTQGKNILVETGVRVNRQYEIDRFLIPYGEYVLYLKQSELKVFFISIANLEVEKVIDLSIPSFYKPLPKDFYVHKNYHFDNKRYLMDLESWSTSYSSITNAVLYDNDYLMLQVRTCLKDKEKFALLLYHLKNHCSLEGVVFMNDLLLAERDGKLFCFRNGNPDLDENTDITQINIYRIINQ